MANPVIGSAKVDKILTLFSQFYPANGTIADLILPTLKVKEKTGKFAKYGKENLRAYATPTAQILRAPGTRALSADYSVSQGTYACYERALEKRVPDEMVNNSDDPYQPKRDATAVLMDNINLNKEVALAGAMSDTGIITQNTTLTGTDQWTDYTNSDPIGDIETGINTVRTATGQRPNTLVIGYASFRTLKNHPQIREQLKYTNGGQPSDDQLSQWIKSYFRLDDVFVGEAVYNAATEGQTDSLTDVWGDNCWVLYRTKQPTLMQATFGLTLQDQPIVVETYREEETISDVIRVRNSFDQNIMDASLAYLIKDTNA